MRRLLKTRRHPLIGALLAPAAPLFALAIITLAIIREIPDIIQGAYMIFPISYPVSFIFGAPVAYLLIKNRKNLLWHFIISGMLMSALATFVILFIPLIRAGTSFEDWNSLYTTIALMLVSSGPVVATTFWAVTRPDLPSEE